MSNQASSLLKTYKSRKIEYVIPSEQEISNLIKLLRLLKKYDEEGLSAIDKTNLLSSNMKPDIYKLAVIADINILLDALSMSTTKLTDEHYEDVLCFHPKVPGTGQIGFFWRFGKDAGPFVISEAHRGTDGTTGASLRAAISLKAKIHLFNTMHPHSSNEPARFQKRRRISDGAHSPDTLAEPFLQTALNELFPSYAINVMHGLAEEDKNGNRRFMEIWIINGVRRPFNLNRRNWGALLTIALAQKDFDFGTISVSGSFPDYYIVDNNGKKRNLVSEPQYDQESVFSYVKGPSSDRQIHTVSVNSNNRLWDSGRAVHIEHGTMYRENNPSEENQVKQAHLLGAMALARKWYTLWDDRVHTFQNMPKDVREFPMWFQEQLFRLESINLSSAPRTLLFNSENSLSDNDEFLDYSSDEDLSENNDLSSDEELPEIETSNRATLRA